MVHRYSIFNNWSNYSSKDLVKIFATVIRPVIEYAVPVYHSLLTEDQNCLIESLQRRTLKVIYGHKISYARALEISGLPTLEDRRKKIVKKFVLKLSTNSNFSHWIPTHRPYVYNMRNVQKYQEEKLCSNGRLIPILFLSAYISV